MWGRLGCGSGPLRAWARYDRANSAFATTIMAAFLPVYCSTVVARDLGETTATAYWGYTTALALALVFVVANIGFAGANVFYEALLPSLAEENEIDRVSTAEYALGYLGGGVLAVVDVAAGRSLAKAADEAMTSKAES
ncbi:MAG: hypothetical protein P8188_15240 [Gemmatimonadota bacterium]